MSIGSLRSQESDVDMRVQPQAIRIESHGLVWSGSWTVENDKLVVTSAYGSRTTPMGQTDNLDSAAQAVMSAIIYAWRTRRV
jgi:hypothetical protein